MSGERKIIFLIVVLAVFAAEARNLNDKLMNRPYADLRAWHLGFSVGMQFQDIDFSHTGEATYDGTTWYMEQPSISPGFCVNALVDFRLSRFFNLRFSPGLYFGSREIKMIESTGQETANQTLKSTYVVVPIDLKFSGLRYRNSRPYISAGLMPAFDIAKKRSNLLELTTADCYLTVGLGCDFYLPYFKFIPEIKFCFGLADVLRHDRPDLEEDPMSYRFTQSIKRAHSSMVVLTFYFE